MGTAHRAAAVSRCGHEADTLVLYSLKVSLFNICKKGKTELSIEKEDDRHEIHRRVPHRLPNVQHACHRSSNENDRRLYNPIDETVWTCHANVTGFKNAPKEHTGTVFRL